MRSWVLPTLAVSAAYVFIAWAFKDADEIRKTAESIRAARSASKRSRGAYTAHKPQSARASTWAKPNYA